MKVIYNEDGSRTFTTSGDDLKSPYKSIINCYNKFKDENNRTSFLDRLIDYDFILGYIKTFYKMFEHLESKQTIEHWRSRYEKVKEIEKELKK